MSGIVLQHEATDGTSRYVVDEPTFSIEATARGWRVTITWSDGDEGPAIAFASRADAETWITRDAHAWLVRLSAITPVRS